MLKLTHALDGLALKVANDRCSEDRARYIIAMESNETKNLFWKEVEVWKELIKEEQCS